LVPFEGGSLSERKAYASKVGTKFILKTHFIVVEKTVAMEESTEELGKFYSRSLTSGMIKSRRF
jgi:hypothetical protein